MGLWTHAPTGVIAAVALLCAAAYAAWGLRVHDTLHSTAFDLGFFDQILWNTAHGRLFQTTFVGYDFLGQHFELILLPLAALYRLGAGPQTLIVLQASLACAAALPLFIAGRRLVAPLPAALLALDYLVSPVLQRGLNFGFHPDLFEPLFAFSAIALLLAGRRRVALLPLLLLLITKEDACLLAALVGWVCALKVDRRLGLVIIGVAALWGTFVIGVAMPLLRDGHAGDLVARYGYLGSSPAGVVVGALLHPDRVVAHLAQPAPAGAVLLLLLVTGFLPLAAPEVLVAALPVALVSLLSTHGPQETLDLQYGVPLLTGCFVAALFGLARLRQAPLVPATVAIGCALGAAYVLGPYPGERAYAAWRFRDDGAPHSLQSVARLIPPEAGVSAQSGLAPHLSQRGRMYEFPGVNGADYIVLQDNGIVSGQGQGQTEYRLRVTQLPALGYFEAARDGHIVLYRRADVGGGP